MAFVLISEAQSRITSIEVEENGVIVLEGYTPGTAYIGITLNNEGSPQKDLSVVKVSGAFSVRVSVLNEFPELIRQTRWINEGVAGIASLWEKKTIKIICGRGIPSKACSFCQKNGFHLENRLARDEFHYKIYR